jgi:hypothetical protein
MPLPASLPFIVSGLKLRLGFCAALTDYCRTALSEFGIGASSGDGMRLERYDHRRDSDHRDLVPGGWCVFQTHAAPFTTQAGFDAVDLEAQAFRKTSRQTIRKLTLS